MTNEIVPFKENYSLLKVQPVYDEEKVKQFAMAANERKILQARLKQLENLMRDNSELTLWTHTKKTGEVVAVSEMDSGELTDALAETGSDHGKYLEAELNKRESEIK